MPGHIEIFKLVILLTLSSSKLIFILLTLDKSKLILLVPFLLSLNRLQLFYWIWARHAAINNPNPLLLIRNSRTRHRIWHKPFLIIQSGRIKNWLPQTINRLQRSSLFLSVTYFLFAKNKICMIRIKTKSFTELGKYLLNGHFFWLYCQELYLEPNQKSMVEIFCKNS